MIMNRMIMMRSIIRYAAVNKQQLHTSIKLMSSNDSPSSSDSSDSDNEKPEKKKPKVANKSREASIKKSDDYLTSLLNKMMTDQSKQKTMDRAIPKRVKLPRPDPPPSLEQQIVDAAKDAANSMEGDKKEIETELLNKVFSTDTSDKPTPTDKKSTVLSASLSDIFSGMKIDRTPDNRIREENLHSQSSRVQEMARQFQYKSKSPKNSKHDLIRRKASRLYGGVSLNIFDPVTETPDDTPKLKTWELLRKKELELILTRPPENIFEEMIQWTNKGLLWKFPINNEIGMEEEENIHFSEHVFMERNLQDWCPKTGPIRHFMELVCVGLSKNPYMTVQEKRGHIMWYREFFGSKQELLEEVGAIPRTTAPNTNAIES